MAHGTQPDGTEVKLALVVVLAAAILGGSGWFASRKTPTEDPRLAGINVDVVPPPDERPFDPKPLMEKLSERITTDKFRFAALGDTKHATTLPAFMKYLEETVNPDFVLTTGDMVQSGGGKVGPGYYQLLTNELGQSMRKRPWWPAIGNHEVAGNPVFPNKTEKDQLRHNQQTGIENFKRFYNLDSDHYSFAFRNCYFIVLPFRHPKDEQLKWLEDELKKASEAKKHIFILNHVLFFTIGAKGKDEVPNIETPITKLFKQYGVKAVFSGHDHGYYRTVRNGIPYFVSAGGGATIYAAKRLSEALSEDVYYYGVPETFGKAEQDKRYMLHKNDGQPNKITDKPDQFMCVIDVDGDKIDCVTVTVKGEIWDKIKLSK